MYICICNAITESEVRRCVRHGACSLADLRAELGVAAGCGRCAATAIAILEEEAECSGYGRTSRQTALNPA